MVGAVALASWFFYKRRRRPGRMAKKYGHYVSKDAKKKPDLANNFEGERAFTCTRHHGKDRIHYGLS